MFFELRDNLHWCVSGGRAVFLDVAADRYFCLSDAANQAFLSLAAGITQPNNSLLLQSLVARGMLVDAGHETRIQSPPKIEEPACDFIADPFSGGSGLHVARALLSELRLTWVLRTRSFERVLKTVESDNGQRRRSPTSSSRMIRAIVAGSAAAAFVTRSHDRCLVRACAVYSMCRKHGSKPKLVFGVIAHPFAAHCWVQLGSSVLVGGYEQARLYTPILVLE
ncbi:MAG TPA: lasso peptide biosynthesis B2 protein [Sphingomicrobium sp.]|nr:lasso peptide biosynthesis B2 protein [Sphingomicrobium sp.]